MGRKKYKQINDKSRKRARVGNTQGQALIEFVLGLMIVIAFFFFYVKMAALFAVGNFIHYATFMAARAYSSSAENVDAQRANAEAVLQKLLAGRWKALIKPDGDTGGAVPGATIGEGPYFAQNPDLDHWNQGVVYSFKTDLSLYPWSRGGAAIDLKLSSESWMTREETETEVRAVMERARNMASGAGRIPNMQVEWDNGY